MTTEQAKCLALLQLLNRCGEKMLLDHLQDITVTTQRRDTHVAVTFHLENTDEKPFRFRVNINCQTGVVYSYDQD